MRKIALLLATACLLGLPTPGHAHTGGPLDADGCHEDHRTGEYHCHRGAAAGCSFPSKAAMQEAVRSGRLPEKTVEVDGFFSKLWPWGKHREEEEASGPAPGASAGSAAAPAEDAANAGAARKQQEIEEKLKVLQGLYEMGLITKEEYEARRKTVLDQL